MHRFYTGKKVTGILMILTVGGFGFWWLIDMVLIAAGRFRDREGNSLFVGPPKPDYPYAGFWVRFAAMTADGFILAAGIIAIALPLLILTGGVARLAQSPEADPIVSMAETVITLGYFIALTASRHQATIGKLIFGIYVVPVNGGQVSVLRSTGRFFSYILSYLTLFIGFILAAFHKEKRALHDLVAGTVVMYGKPDADAVSGPVAEASPVAKLGDAIEEQPEPRSGPAPARAAASGSFVVGTRGPIIAIILGVILLASSVAQQFF